MYAALVKDAEEQPERWDLMGRQADVWKQFGTLLYPKETFHLFSKYIGYIPSDEFSKGGLNTRQVSRTLEVIIFLLSI